MIDQLFIFGAEYLFIASLLIVGFFFFRQPRSVQKRIILVGLVSFAITYFIAFIGSLLYNNPRPFVAQNFVPLIPHLIDNGFPSNHALFVSAFAALFWLFDKKISLLLWLIALVVSISRVYVGVHHPIDVLGSITIAIVAIFLTKEIFKIVDRKSVQKGRV